MGIAALLPLELELLYGKTQINKGGASRRLYLFGFL